MKRSRTLAVVLVFGLTLFGTGASAAFIDGYQLKEWSDANTRIERGSVSSSDLDKESYLIGYVSGVNDISGGVVYCSPKNAKLGQLMGVVTKYLLANPERWNQPGGMLVLEALRQAFPCK